MSKLSIILSKLFCISCFAGIYAQELEPEEQLELEQLEEQAEEQKQQILVNNTSVLFADEVKVSVPKSLQTKYVRAYWKKLTKSLISLHVLSPNDLPQLETMCIVLEKLREAEAQLQLCEVGDMETFEYLLKVTKTLSDKFDALAKNYYISPAARTKLRLDDLNVIKAQQEIVKNNSAINNLLSGRKARD